MFNGPLVWNSKRQNITVGISEEAEIFSIHECVKELIGLRILLLYLKVLEVPKAEPFTVYNDNMDCIYWSK